jgi:flap endonuclease-1
MGLQIGDIVPRKEVSFADLKGKVIAIDAFNAIYQFLSSIRQPDGTPLMDSRKRVTSHLSGLFYRNVALLAEGIKLIYVFDGEYHELKGATHNIRNAAKASAREKYEDARDEGDVAGMGKYSRGFIKLNSEMIAESKELLEALGIPVVQAPGEGEMQAAYLVKQDQAYAVGSQDYDSLVSGARMIQNLTLARKRKIRGGDFIYIAPEMIEYDKTLNALGLNGDQLICLAILVGTDFNPGGIKGIGPKKALTFVRQFKQPVAIFEHVLAEKGDLGFDWKVVFEIFKKPNVKKVDLNFPKLNEVRLKEILVIEHEFSLERVNSQLAKLIDVKKQQGQKKLF